MHMKMKNIIYIIALILFSGCGNFLDEYSQDLVVPKTVSDLNEVLLISTFGRSRVFKKWLYRVATSSIG